MTGGLFTTRLGSDIALPDTLFSSGAQRFLGIKVNLDPEMPRVRLLTVPAAYHSLRSDSTGFATNANLLDGQDGSAFAPAVHSHVVTTAEIQNGTILFQDIAQNGATTGQVMTWNGAAWVPDVDQAGGAVSLDLLLVEEPTVTVNPNSTVPVSVDAPSGYKVVSGAWERFGGSGQLEVTRSYPANSELNQWLFEFRGTGATATNVNTFVVCARLTP